MTTAPIFMIGARISDFGTSSTSTQPVSPTGAEAKSIVVPSSLQEAMVGLPLKKALIASALSFWSRIVSSIVFDLCEMKLPSSLRRKAPPVSPTLMAETKSFTASSERSKPATPAT